MFKFLKNPELLYSTYPYCVVSNGSRCFIAVQTENGAEEFLEVPNLDVGKDFADMLQAQRMNRVVMNPEI